MTQSVYVGRMHCTSTSDSSDDIYLVMFRDRTVLPFNSAVVAKGRGNFWDDFDDGEAENTDVLMVQYFSDAVYGVMMIEKDADKDIVGDIVSTYSSDCDTAWKLALEAQQLAGVPPGSEAARQAGGGQGSVHHLEQGFPYLAGRR